MKEPDHAPTLLSEAYRKELERRLDEDDANPEAAVPWEEVEQSLLAQLHNLRNEPRNTRKARKKTDFR